MPTPTRVTMAAGPATANRQHWSILHGIEFLRLSQRSTSHNVAGCSCTGSGSSKSCTGNLYDHNWTQPGPTTRRIIRASLGLAPWSVSPISNKSRYNKPVDGSARNLVLVRTTGPRLPLTPSAPGPAASPTAPSPTTRPSDAPDLNDAATLFPANQYYENSTAYCDTNISTPLEPIMPLSYNWSTLKTDINAMQPTGGTNQAIGLAWAWQSLLQTSPCRRRRRTPTLHLQQGHHPPVRRSEYRRSLAGIWQRQHAKQRRR